MKRIGPAAAAVTAAVGILATGCSSGPNEVPSEWIRDTYDYGYVSGIGGYVDSSDKPQKVADEIDGNTAAADRHADGGMVFLRYEDDMVAVKPHKSGSFIDVDEYDDGYDRYRSHVGSIWPAPGSKGFRGGGPGSGK